MTDIELPPSTPPPPLRPSPPANSSFHPSTPSSISSSLLSHPLFSRASPQFIAHLTSRLHCRFFAPNDIIIREGEPARAMFFLLRGRVKVCSKDEESVYCELAGGSFFGEIGILFSIPRTATIVARTKCFIAALRADDLKAVLPLYPEMERIIRFEAEERYAMLMKKRAAAQPANEDLNQGDLRGEISKVPLFQNCSDEILHQISLVIEPRTYLPNDYVTREGELGGEMYFLRSGLVEVLAGPREDLLGRLLPGQFFGEISVLTNVPRTASIRAATRIEVFVLKKKDLDFILKHYPEAAEQVRDIGMKRYKEWKKRQEVEQKESPLEALSVDVTMEEANGKVDIIISPAKAPSLVGLLYNTTADIYPESPDHLGPVAGPYAAPRKRRASANAVAELHATSEQEGRRHLTVETISGNQLFRSKSQDRLIKSRSAALAETAKALGKVAPRSLLAQAEVPDAILARILGHLSVPEAMGVLRVNRQWNRVLRTHPDLFTSVDLSPWGPRLNDEIFTALMRFIGLRVERLSIRKCFYITDRGVESLARYCGRIKVLDMASCWDVTDAGVQMLAEELHQLHELDLSNCRRVLDSGIIALVHGAGGRRRDWSAMQRAPGGGANGSRLTRLRLSYCKSLTDRSMEGLTALAGQLEQLTLQRCTTITDQGFEAWAGCRFSALRELDLSDCTFLSDRAMACIAESCPGLFRLNLSFCCALTDVALALLAEGCIRLKEVNVAFCGSMVSDRSVHALVSSAGFSLRKLSLRGCVRLSDMGVACVLRGCPRLEWLDVTQCRGVSDEFKGRMRQLLGGKLQVLA
ncbi:uncharacterized protein VTP21DRAFT_11136 [Calcarisporiella thermophila]|uniref:uncharacterized protein n=1 Tax=Calcarisporiella thermophila TaxID=911321 RepID=UPI0037448564